MGIIAINVFTTGLTGQSVNPRRCTLITTDNLATITTAGYLNNQNILGNQILPTDIFEILYSFNEQTQVGIFGIFQVTYSSATGFTLNLWENPGNVLLPVVSGDFAVFNGTSGQIRDAGFLPSDATKTRVVMANAATLVNHIMVSTDLLGTSGNLAGTAINDGSIQAGRNTIAGTLISFPATTTTGSLIVAAVSNAGAFNVTISNASHGQSSVYSIPNSGAATANFLISALSGGGVQHITTGSLQVDAGGLLAGLAAGGTAGSLTLFPATTANGSLILSPINAGGAFNTTISNGTMGQSSVFTLPDPGNALARILVGATATPFTTAHLLASSGTGGLVADSGIATSAVQLSANIQSASTADIGGGGAGPISVIVAGLTASSKIVATIASSSNVVAVAKCIATATGFDITFTGDPGAACVVNYVAFVVAQ